MCLVLRGEAIVDGRLHVFDTSSNCTLALGQSNVRAMAIVALFADDRPHRHGSWPRHLGEPTPAAVR